MNDDVLVDLVNAAAAGDKAAWDELVDRFSGLVWAMVRGYRLQSHDAADAFQTTWLRAVEHLAAIRQPERFAGWLATTARREALRVLRTRGREPATEPEVLDAVLVDHTRPETRIEREQRDELLWHCFEAGSGRCRELLRVLTADPPLSYAEVADTLDMPIGGIGPTRRRCLEQLRERLAQAGLHDGH